MDQNENDVELPESKGRPLQRVALLCVIAVIVVAGAIFTFRFRASTDLRKAVSAESRGEYAEALGGYTAAAGAHFPGMPVPKVNRSKALSPASWKKEMAEYASWLSGLRATKAVGNLKATLLGAITRNAPLINAENFLGSASVQDIPIERYTELWNGAFFARNVPADPGHRSLAAYAFGKSLSIIKFSARITYTYSVTLLDTAAGRRTTFTVYPESATFALAPPGAHLLICQSSFTPSPGRIWRSSPSIIPLAVPATPSFMSYTIETHVTRKGADGK